MKFLFPYDYTFLNGNSFIDNCDIDSIQSMSFHFDVLNV